MLKSLFAVLLFVTVLNGGIAPARITQLAPPPNRRLDSLPQTQQDDSVVSHVRVDSEDYSYQVNPDYTYTNTISQRITVLTTGGIQAASRTAWSYYPDSQGLELAEAYVIQPDGSKVAVAPDNIFTRPSPEAQDAPGFTNSMTTTVVFPQLQVGSQTFVSWKFTQKTPSVIGFSDFFSPGFNSPTVKQTVRLVLPAALKLQWQKRGDYQVTDQTQGKQRMITAVITNQPQRRAENGMVESLDVSPAFVFSNLNRWEELGAMSWRRWRDRVVVTPEIQQLASTIVGNKQGLDAAAAIYNWVAQNISYTAVYLDLVAGFIPNTSTTVLQHGYGDCKDHVVLMQALLKARGIDSYPVLVNWGSLFQPLPLPVAYQFNHAMIYLPAYEIFANPTAAYAEFGNLDRTLRGKMAVVVSDKGQMVSIPLGEAKQNRYALENVITIASDGGITGKSKLQFNGDFSSAARSTFVAAIPKQIADQLLAQTPEGGHGSLEVQNLDQLDQSVAATGKWSSPYGVQMGKRVYLSTPLGIDYANPAWLRQYITPTPRQYPIVVGAGDYRWSYTITVPTAYKLHQLPEDKQLSNQMGSYSSHYQVSGNTILVKRNLTIKNDVYSAEAYPALLELLYKAVNDVRSLIVLDQQ
jgi:transglutaminase-like putative cysteine protease